MEFYNVENIIVKLNINYFLNFDQRKCIYLPIEGQGKKQYSFILQQTKLRYT